MFANTLYVQKIHIMDIKIHFMYIQYTSCVKKNSIKKNVSKIHLMKIHFKYVKCTPCIKIHVGKEKTHLVHIKIHFVYKIHLMYLKIHFINMKNCFGIRHIFAEVQNKGLVYMFVCICT